LQRYILRRLITIVPTIIIVSLVSFSIILFLPGDPALAILGPERAADKEAYARIRQDMGLDRPVPVQYVEWAGKAVRGDLGTSVRNQQPVLEGIKERLPVTILLGACAMILGLLIAIPVGIISAVRPNSKADAIGTIFALSGVAVPHFWLGILLIFLFGVTLRWLPPSGFVSR
jgi:peptide/nickel transport system permease protein